MTNTERPLSFLKDGLKSPSFGVNPASLNESEHHIRAEFFETALPGLSGSPDKPRGLSIQPCKSEKEEPYIRYSSQGRSECLYLRIE